MRVTRAAIYLRQSKDVEGTRAAVDRQLEDCTELCERRGWEVIRVITDNDTSASSRKPRPGYRSLLADVEAGATDVVVAWATDRLLRRITEMEELIVLVEKFGVQIATVQAGHVDLSTSDGRTMARMGAVIAQGEVEKKADRQRREQRQAAERGDAPSRRAFGYRYVRDGRNRKAELHPEEFVVVRDAFDRLFRGESLVKITAAVNAAGLPSVRGNRWHRKGVRYMLMSPRYAGIRTYHGEVIADGDWPTIISREEHEKAVALLADPVRRPEGFRGTARRWLGSGLFECGKCVSDVRCGYRTLNNVRTYVCREHAHLSRAAEPVDARVLTVVAARLGMPDAADLLTGSSAELASLREERDSIQRKINRAVRDYDDEVIDGATLKAVKSRRITELAVVERKIAAAARSSRLAQLGTATDPAAAFLDADLQMQREVIDALCRVVLLPSPRGTSRFKPESVEFAWRSENSGTDERARAAFQRAALGDRL